MDIKVMGEGRVVVTTTPAFVLQEWGINIDDVFDNHALIDELFVALFDEVLEEYPEFADDSKVYFFRHFEDEVLILEVFLSSLVTKDYIDELESEGSFLDVEINMLRELIGQEADEDDDDFLEDDDEDDEHYDDSVEYVIVSVTPHIPHHVLKEYQDGLDDMPLDDIPSSSKNDDYVDEEGDTVKVQSTIHHMLLDTDFESLITKGDLPYLKTVNDSMLKVMHKFLTGGEPEQGDSTMKLIRNSAEYKDFVNSVLNKPIQPNIEKLLSSHFADKLPVDDSIQLFDKIVSQEYFPFIFKFKDIDEVLRLAYYLNRDVNTMQNVLIGHKGYFYLVFLWKRRSSNGYYMSRMTAVDGDYLSKIRKYLGQELPNKIADTLYSEGKPIFNSNALVQTILKFGS